MAMATQALLVLHSLMQSSNDLVVVEVIVAAAQFTPSSTLSKPVNVVYMHQPEKLLVCSVHWNYIKLHKDIYYIWINFQRKFKIEKNARTWTSISFQK